MKIIHLGDLHIGKRVNEFSMIEDQKYILNEIIKIIDIEKPKALVIAGDVYDKAIPPEQAVTVLDDFLVELANRNIITFVISGNHDSAERIGFGSRLMQAKGIYMSQNSCKNIKPIELSDEHGKLDIYMLPFVKMGQVKVEYENDDIENYTQAIKTVLDSFKLDKSKKNILIAHQFVTGASTCESEDIFVGGSENVDCEVFENFDYVALGHLHSPQFVKKETIRYSGSPLKYSFSEVNQKKSVTVIEFTDKVKIKEIPLKPLKDLKEIKGACDELVSIIESDEDYIHAVLTDEEDVIDALAKLRSVYPNIMKISYDNKRTKASREILLNEKIPELKPIEVFAEFYKKQNNKDLSESQNAILEDVIDRIWGGDFETD